MAWDFVGATATAAGSSGNATVTLPAGIQQGDLLVAFLSFRDSAPYSAPAGWTIARQELLGNLTVGPGSGAISSGLIAYIVRGASDPALTFTRTGGGIARAAVHAYRQTTPPALDATTAFTLTVESMTLTAPALTTRKADALIVALGCAPYNGAPNNVRANGMGSITGSGSSIVTTPGPVSSAAWTNRSRNSTATAQGVGICTSDVVKTAAGSTGDILETGLSLSLYSLLAVAFYEPITPAVGTAAGTSSASAVSQDVRWGAGASAGTSAAAGDGASLAASAGVAAGSAAGTGDGAAFSVGAGLSSGLSLVEGTGSSLAASSGIAAGVATVSGASPVFRPDPSRIMASGGALRVTTSGLGVRVARTAGSARVVKP